MKKAIKKKRGKPEKNCPSCDHVNHARSSNCKSCDYQFYVTKTKQREIMAANWQELSTGDIIKCVAGSGPYFLSRDHAGEKIYMGHKGKFEVDKIIYKNKTNCGIVGRKLLPYNHKGLSREYIYMGESHYDEKLSIHREPHKIIVIKKQETDGESVK